MKQDSKSSFIEQATLKLKGLGVEAEASCKGRVGGWMAFSLMLVAPFSMAIILAALCFLKQEPLPHPSLPTPDAQQSTALDAKKKETPCIVNSKNDQKVESSKTSLEKKQSALAIQRQCPAAEITQ